MAATICIMAEASSYAAQHTDDANDFFKRLAAWAPTHIVVDLQLADRDGIEVLHQLAILGCMATVIIISGLGGRIQESAARIAAENGLNLAGTLSKPFSRSDLMRLLAINQPASLPGQGHSPTSQQSTVSAKQLVAALQSKSLTTHFQPKISCLNGQHSGFECLARWPQQDGSMIPPDVFINLAEREGLIHELTRQVYDYALAHRPRKGKAANLKFALNLSPVNLVDETFPRWLMAKCAEHDISPSRIILELTETASMDNPLGLLENLTQFRIRGFHLSIDDFGVGFSSLVQLARLPFSELKIDRMFIKSLSQSEESRKIVTAVVGLGSSLGLNVVAEGVEDLWALEFLRKIECDEAQGYFIARPMDESAATQWTGFEWKEAT